MAPITHFLASWIIAAKTTDNPRDCRLVTLAGILPDLVASVWSSISPTIFRDTMRLIITPVITIISCMAHLALWSLPV